MRHFYTKNHISLIIIFLLFSGIISGEKKFDLNQWSGNFNIKGENAFDQFGYQISSGDINGDGIDDTIMSSPSADPLGRNSAGEVYIFWGNDQTEQSVSLDLNLGSADE